MRYWTIILLLLILAGCHNSIEDKVRDIDLMLNKVEQLDKKYGTEWKNERIDINMLSLEKIDKYINELNNEQNLDNISKVFVELRTRMLEAEKAYQTAQKQYALRLIELNLGAERPVSFEPLDQLDCSRKNELRIALQKYEESLNKGHKTFNLLDWVLQNSPESREKIGVNNNRPRFYYSRFADLSRTIKFYEKVLPQLCG